MVAEREVQRIPIGVAEVEARMLCFGLPSGVRERSRTGRNVNHCTSTSAKLHYGCASCGGPERKSDAEDVDVATPPRSLRLTSGGPRTTPPAERYFLYKDLMCPHVDGSTAVGQWPVPPAT